MCRGHIRAPKARWSRRQRRRVEWSLGGCPLSSRLGGLGSVVSSPVVSGAKPRPQTHFLHILVHITPLIEYFDFQSSSAVWTTDPTIIFVAVRSWGDCRDCPLATPLHFVATLHLAMTRSIYPTPAIGKVKVNSLRVMWDKGESYPIIWILVSYCTRY